jgi:hypothetical protein
MHEKRTIQKLHIQAVFLKMKPRASKNVEADKNQIQKLI